jgi:hypothetical protein
MPFFLGQVGQTNKTSHDPTRTGYVTNGSGSSQQTINARNNSNEGLANNNKTSPSLARQLGLQETVNKLLLVPRNGSLPPGCRILRLISV